MINHLSLKRNILPNGIRLVQFPRSQKMTAQLSIVVKNGLELVSESNAGIPHFLEHMIGGGSEEHINAMHSIEQNGGSLELSTELEYTMGYADVFQEKLYETSQIFLMNVLFQRKFFGAAAGIHISGGE
jgi:predicted Zn-dependent peptidase